MYESNAYKMIKEQIDVYFKQNNIEGGSSMNPLAQRSFEKNQKEIMDMLRQLLGMGVQGTLGRSGKGFNFGLPEGQNELFENVGWLWPPVPNGELNGHSFKFNQEISTALGGSASPKDIPFLQLQLLECFALIERKDDTVRLLNDELEKAYERVRKYVLMQD